MVLTLTWNPSVFEAVDQPISADTDWITFVDWLSMTIPRTGLPTSPGIYLVYREAPTYVGLAGNLREEFASRSQALHQLAISVKGGGSLAGTGVRIATVTSDPPYSARRYQWTQAWLARLLFLDDTTQVFQNTAVASFRAPSTGLSFRFLEQGAPFSVCNQPGYQTFAGGLVGYDYAPNAPVLQ